MTIALKTLRMWHWAQVQQYKQLMEKATDNQFARRKYELRAVMHLRFVECLDAVVPGTVQDDNARYIYDEEHLDKLRVRKDRAHPPR